MSRITDIDVKQQQILQAIFEYVEEHKIAPTIRELGTIVGLSSSSTVHKYVNRLEEQGYITKHPTMPRTIQILKLI